MPEVLRFLRCGRGNVIVTFAIMLPLLIGAGGTAIDYGNVIRIRNVEASVADSTALFGANSDAPLAANQAVNLAKSQLVARLGGQSSDYNVSAGWIDDSNYRVRIDTTKKTMLVHLLPGVSNRNVTVAVAATVNRVAPEYETLPPTLTQLSPDALDYNRVYMYCYSSDLRRQREADQGRRDLRPIADNATPQTFYDMSNLPKCRSGEVPSYMLWTIENARKDPSNWNNTSKAKVYFTDITIDNTTRVETMHMNGYNLGSGASIDIVANPILETVICTSVRQCKPRSEGGILPNNGSHTPARATGGCDEDKFMYFGWEDRPAFDGDYNDIRLVVSCPKQIKTSDKKLRIVE